MCGRGRQTAPTVQAVAQSLQVPIVFQPPAATNPQQQQQDDEEEEDEYSPFNNGAPGRTAPIVVEGPPSEPAVMRLARWGLVPAYQSPSTKPDFWRMFNAREDNLVNVHARLLNSKRCVVPLEGFYEWENRIELGKKRKVPYYVSSPAKPQLPFAGLWDTWKNEQGKLVHSFTLITVSPSEDLKWLHDRMPAILQSEEEISMWLNQDLSFQQVKHLVRPYKVGGLRWWPVTDNIGRLGYQEPDCASPVELVKGTKSITTFFTSKKKPSECSKDEAIETVKSAPGSDKSFASPRVDKDSEEVIKLQEDIPASKSSPGTLKGATTSSGPLKRVTAKAKSAASPVPGVNDQPTKKTKVSDFFSKNKE